MSPEVIGIIRLISRIAVVLPEPDGPTSTQTSPAGTVNDRSRIAGSRWPAYRLLTFRSSSSAACANADSPSLWAVWAVFKEDPRPGAQILAHGGRSLALSSHPGRVAQPARAPRLHRGGRPFESGRAHQHERRFPNPRRRGWLRAGRLLRGRAPAQG